MNKRVIKKIAYTICSSGVVALGVISAPLTVKADRLEDYADDSWNQAYVNTMVERGAEFFRSDVESLCRKLEKNGVKIDPDQYINDNYYKLCLFGIGELQTMYNESLGLYDYEERKDGYIKRVDYFSHYGRGEVLPRVHLSNENDTEIPYLNPGVHDIFNVYVGCKSYYVQVDYYGEENKAKAYQLAKEYGEANFMLVDLSKNGLEYTEEYYKNGDLLYSLTKYGEPDERGQEGYWYTSTVYKDASGNEISQEDSYKLFDEFQNAVIEDVQPRGQGSCHAIENEKYIDAYKDVEKVTHEAVELIIEKAPELNEKAEEFNQVVDRSGNYAYSDDTTVILAGYEDFKDAVRDALFKMINDYRVENGVEPLKDSSKVLSEFAETRAMESQYRMDANHTRPDGTSVGRMINVGENIAAVSFTGSMGSQEVAEIMFNSLKESPGHNQNMLLEDYKSGSLGIALGKTGDTYTITAANDFARYEPEIFDDRYKDFDTSMRMPKFIPPGGKFEKNEVTGDIEIKAGVEIDHSVNSGEGYDADGLHVMDNGDWFMRINGDVKYYGRIKDQEYCQKILGSVPIINGKTPDAVVTRYNVNAMYTSVVATDGTAMPELTISTYDYDYLNYYYVFINNFSQAYNGAVEYDSRIDPVSNIASITGTNDPNTTTPMNWNDVMLRNTPEVTGPYDANGNVILDGQIYSPSEDIGTMYYYNGEPDGEGTYVGGAYNDAIHQYEQDMNNQVRMNNPGFDPDAVGEQN